MTSPTLRTLFPFPFCIRVQSTGGAGEVVRGERTAALQERPYCEREDRVCRRGGGCGVTAVLDFVLERLGEAIGPPMKDVGTPSRTARATVSNHDVGSGGW
jgi:hypothetical protein